MSAEYVPNLSPVNLLPSHHMGAASKVSHSSSKGNFFQELSRVSERRVVGGSPLSASFETPSVVSNFHVTFSVGPLEFLGTF